MPRLSLLIALAGIFVLVGLTDVNACRERANCKEMRSARYRIELSTSSIGSARMESKSYRIRGTIGQPMISTSKSRNYQIKAGFWPAARMKLRKVKPRPPA